MGELVTWQAPENNKAPILEHLKGLFEETEKVLEIGSGTGQHGVYFASHMPHLVWQPSDRDEYLPMISDRLAVEGPDNMRHPIGLDVDGIWPQEIFDGVFCANAIHIMGWSSVESLFGGIGGILAEQSVLVLYGPFRYGGAFTTQSNADFDQYLKGQDPQSGIRDFEAVDGLARAIGLRLVADHAMPANNQLIVWGR